MLTQILKIAFGIALLILAIGLFINLPDRGDDAVFYIFFGLFAGIAGVAALADGIEDLIKNK